MICDYYIQKKRLGRLIKLQKKFGIISRQISKYLSPLESENLQLEQTKLPVFSLCFGKISKFPVFSLTVIFLLLFSLFSLCSGYPEIRLSHQASVNTCSPEGGVVWNLPYSQMLLKNPELVSFKPCSTI